MFEQLKQIDTYNDGRAPLYDLYKEHLKLVENYGWKSELLYSIKIKTAKGEVDVPVYCFLSPKEGQSIWLLTGIHGEEPAGPNAVARQIDLIGKLGQTIPMVLMPMLNPAGYYRNWRYHHIETSMERLNVTDCRHLTPDPKDPSKPRIKKPVHEIANTVTKYILELLKKYPPVLFFDLHEDELIEGYIYSQGYLSANDPVGAKVVKILVENGMPLKMSGSTRFDGEKIINGLVVDENGKRICDGSVDEFIANEKYFNEQGVLVSKPYAKTSIVVETPSNGALSLDNRVKAHESIITNLGVLWELVKPQ